jgi:hypothetical protein
MSQELAIPGYYSSLYNSNFLSTNIGAKLGMEFFLSTLLFKGDMSKVVYSKEDIAFRRRVELLGNGTVRDQKYNYITLDLPFAIYSQSGSYEEDDRGSTQNAGQIVFGKTEPESGLKIKAAAVKVEYESTIFFGRRDDVNVASQLLYWEKTPKFPVYFGVEHEICGHPLSIPFYITLDSFDSNVDYAEKDWLEKSKIFPVKCKFTIRSYQTLIENIDKYFDLPIRFSGLYGYNNEEIVYTQKTTLLWADEKWSLNEDGTSETEKLIEEKVKEMNEVKVLTVSQAARERIDRGLQEYGRGKVDDEKNEAIRSSVEGYFTEDVDCTLDEFYQNTEKTTENSVNIHWKIKESNLPYFNYMLIYIPGICNISIDNPLQEDIDIEGLYPGSKYDCTLVTVSKHNNKLTYKLQLKTKGEPVLGKTLAANLVGRTFTTL